MFKTRAHQNEYKNRDIVYCIGTTGNKYTNKFEEDG